MTDVPKGGKLAGDLLFELERRQEGADSDRETNRHITECLNTGKIPKKVALGK